MLGMIWPHFNLQKTSPILKTHPLRSARVFFHSASTRMSCRAKSWALLGMSPTAQQIAGSHYIQLLQAVLHPRAGETMTTCAARTCLAIACRENSVPWIPLLLHLLLLKLNWSQFRWGLSRQLICRMWWSRLLRFLLGKNAGRISSAVDSAFLTGQPLVPILDCGIQWPVGPHIQCKCAMLHKVQWRFCVELACWDYSPWYIMIIETVELRK